LIKKKLKSPMQSQGLTKSPPTEVRESQKAGLKVESGGPYIHDKIQGEFGGSEKHHAEILFWLERKLSSSTPSLQARTRPPLVPTRATRVIK
jgi:hypothetical protein